MGCFQIKSRGSRKPTIKTRSRFWGKPKSKAFKTL
ncbi:hypothetical protein CY0110_18812 [Crocosphaera chwakensis CCY0110]|uniref:Uncharacterized protein n=1 Tax=Crocosphaera chwakensis CCY0110 TaxID=391612 RepID=A3IJ94_9CHRO|nr:hypothetical protein CY0110_18812 [Crocosphaera chwakensis CCY0110]